MLKDPRGRSSNHFGGGGVGVGMEPTPSWFQLRIQYYQSISSAGVGVFVAGSEEQLLKASATRQGPSLGHHRPCAAVISTRWLLSEGFEALSLTSGLSAGAETFGLTDAAHLHTYICGSTSRLLPLGLSRSGLLWLLSWPLQVTCWVHVRSDGGLAPPCSLHKLRSSATPT